MRNLAACFVAALLSTTTLTTQIAAACGGSYETVRSAPQVMLVSSHFINNPSSSDTPQANRRAFALRSANLDMGPDAHWEQLASRTYDSTGIITLAKLARPVTTTLVGASGTRVVRSAARVALQNPMFISGSQFDALELPVRANEDFTIALAGNHPDAVWHRVEYNYTYTSTIAGTNLSSTRSYSEASQHEQLSADGHDLGTYDGALLGVADVGGARYAVLSTSRGTAYTVELSM